MARFRLLQDTSISPQPIQRRKPRAWRHGLPYVFEQFFQLSLQFVGPTSAFCCLTLVESDSRSLPRVSFRIRCAEFQPQIPVLTARHGRIRRLASTLPGRQVGETHVSSQCTVIIPYSGSIRFQPLRGETNYGWARIASSSGNSAGSGAQLEK